MMGIPTSHMSPQCIADYPEYTGATGIPQSLFKQATTQTSTYHRSTARTVHQSIRRHVYGNWAGHKWLGLERQLMSDAMWHVVLVNWAAQDTGFEDGEIALYPTKIFIWAWTDHSCPELEKNMRKRLTKFDLQHFLKPRTHVLCDIKSYFFDKFSSGM